MTRGDEGTADNALPPVNSKSLSEDDLRRMLPGPRGAEREAALRDVSVTRDDLQNFLSAGPPRMIPRGIQRQVIYDNFQALMIVTLIGTLAGVLSLAEANQSRNIVNACIGFAMLASVTLMHVIRFTYRRKRWRLLREGRLTSGSVTKAIKSNIQSTEGTPYTVTVIYKGEICDQTVTLEIRGQQGARAAQCAESGQTIRVLVDPLDKKHILCPDFLDIFELEVEQIACEFSRPYEYRSM